MNDKQAAGVLLGLRAKAKNPAAREALHRGEQALLAAHRQSTFIQRWSAWAQGHCITGNKNGRSSRS